jgi:hypothetical protein
LVIIESNHDVSMLKNGRYPHFLKKNILSEQGNLSNDCPVPELPRLVNEGTNEISLAHLNRENNLPLLAYQTALAALQSVVPHRASFPLQSTEVKQIKHPPPTPHPKVDKKEEYFTYSPDEDVGRVSQTLRYCGLFEQESPCVHCRHPAPAKAGKDEAERNIGHFYEAIFFSKSLISLSNS